MKCLKCGNTFVVFFHKAYTTDFERQIVDKYE